MAIVENLVELLPNVGVDICRRTNILAFLLQRVKTKKFDANKLYASELMSILLQSSLYDAESARGLEIHLDSAIIDYYTYRLDTKDVPIQVQLCNIKLQEKDQQEATDGMVCYFIANNYSLSYGCMNYRMPYCKRSLNIERKK